MAHFAQKINKKKVDSVLEEPAGSPIEPPRLDRRVKWVNRIKKAVDQRSDWPVRFLKHRYDLCKRPKIFHMLNCLHGHLGKSGHVAILHLRQKQLEKTQKLKSIN